MKRREKGNSDEDEKGRREIAFNFRVGLVFNSGGFISIRGGLILNGYAMSYRCK